MSDHGSVAQVVFLDLQRMQMHPGSNLLDVGPASCLSGRLRPLEGQMGASSMV